ncbi:MAG TPA: hypothetical protein PKD67_14820 [Ignavibacteriaceae bacterium]|nr:hypothetical protein [Ignavibacteriaceae bacterium]
MKNLFKIFLIITAASLFNTCNTTEPQISDPNQWEKISLFNGMDVKGFKIINDELYAYGWGNNNGLYKTTDGVSWTKMSLPDTGNFRYGVSAITRLNEDLIIASAYSYDGKYLCKISKDGIQSIIPTPVQIEIADMEVIDNNVFIAAGRDYIQYYSGILKPTGELNLISNLLYTNPYIDDECSIGNAINPIYSSKLIKVNNNVNYLISGERAGPNFVTKIDTNGYQCFIYKGITTSDKFAGVFDLVLYQDTLFAATEGYIKFFFNNEWKVYKDSLPKPHGTVPFVTSLTFANNTVYLTTLSDGVLKWENNKWISIGEGLPKNEEYNVYPGISYIIAFKNNLFIGFGTGKVWDNGMRGVWKYSLK